MRPEGSFLLVQLIVLNSFSDIGSSLSKNGSSLVVGRVTSMQLLKLKHQPTHLSWKEMRVITVLALKFTRH